MKYPYILFIGFLSLACFGQSNLINSSYEKALQLYKNEQYLPAKHFFEQALKTESSLKEIYLYYIASSAIRSGLTNADTQMENYLKMFPHSILAQNARLDIADFYFSQANYNQALHWYNQTNINNIDSYDKDKHNFQKGYALFYTNQKDRAKAYFSQVNSQSQYALKANYYLGYIAYDQNDYSRANAFFEQVENDTQLAKNLSYYQAHMSFQQGDFQKAIEQGKAQLEKKKNSPKDLSEIHKIIGESYFNLKDYPKASAHLSLYKGKNGKYSNTDFYYLGYAHYQQKNYQKAIDQFNKIIEWNNSVAQNAYYHLAECYLKTNQKQQALNAFRNAAQMDFNADIQKDAHWNYAKLSYDIGNPYQSVPEVILEFIKKYPEHQPQQMKNLLLNSYLSSKNYPSAFRLLEKSKSVSDKAIYYQVALYYALEQYTNEKYTQARMLLEIASKSTESTTRNKALFWWAEVEYILKNYSKSQNIYEQFLTLSTTKNEYYSQSLYGLGYSLFHQKKYTEAVSVFEKFIKISPKNSSLYEEVFLRIGDCYFALTKYWPAMDAYQKIIEINGTETDYALYQSAIAYGLVNRITQKINGLNRLIDQYPKSYLRQNALLELGNTLLSLDKNSEALLKYDQLQQEYPQGSLVSKAMLRQVLIYYNTDDNEKSLSIIKKIAQTFPNSSEAHQAVNIAKSIYIELGKVEEYAQWAKSLGYIQVNNSELDAASFESVERLYLQDNDQEAINGFEKYLRDFPQGIHRLQTQFLLAELYYKNNHQDKAKHLYENISLQANNPYTEQTLVRLSQIYLSEKNSKTIPVFKQLEKVASLEQNQIYAQSNLMELFYTNQDYSKALLYAEKILTHKQSDSRIQSDAHIIMSRSYLALGNLDLAKKHYNEVRKTASGELMAEAIYYDAFFKNQEGHYKDSNKIIEQLAKDYGGYKEFSAKGLVLMAQNFHKLNDNYQATYILNSVIENFNEFPSLTNQAKNLLNEIKTQTINPSEQKNQ